ncbi:MAG: TrkA family potassium uptake protein [Cellvibrionales bacterium]|nr:TrkA family potassium uptake protein [Cellvibrionales bacterium]
MKQIAVIGLGQFGTNLCIALAKAGVQVMAVDKNEKPVHKLSEIVSQAVIADISDEDTASELDITSFDCVVLCMGSDIQSSLLITILLKEMGVVNLWVKAKDNLHVKTMLKIGADRVINPERDMAIRVSEQLVNEGFVDYLHLPDNLAMMAVSILDSEIGQQLSEINYPNDVSLLAIKRAAELLTQIDPSESLQAGDMLILSGQKQALQQFLAR